MRTNVCIVGLGLMGSSLAYALAGFRDAVLTGVDADPAVVEKALAKGAVDRASTELLDLAPEADLIIFCVYAHHIPGLLERCMTYLKPGAVVTDICGVKTGLYEAILPLPRTDVDYIGVHPMAGKERDGFDNGEASIFRNTGFILCPLESTQPESVTLMKELAAHIGATKITVTDYRRHDEIIAYTSDLMHIASAGLCVDFHPDLTSAFTAGAFRDCTRVADINADAWTELLLSNGPNVVNALDRYLDSLSRMRRALTDRDDDALHDLLERAGHNKREMLRR